MRRGKLALLVSLSVAIFVGCADENAGRRISQGEQIDAGDEDTAAGTPAPEDAGPTPEPSPADVVEEPAVEPDITQEPDASSADAGGETDRCDGGICACEVGVAQNSRCGACELGAQRCDAGETGPGWCELPDIPGLPAGIDASNCAQKLIFVDSAASAGGDGSREAPFNLYADALSSAAREQIIIIGGEKPLREMIEVKNGVSIVGGFSSGPEFMWAEDQASNIEVPAPTDNDVFGLRAEQVDQTTLVSNLSIKSADAAAEKNNYGAYLFESPALILSHLDVRAGSGGDGINGGNGAEGATGTNGEDGNGAHGIPVPGGSYIINYTGGLGGQGALNAECADANGGDGGSGGTGEFGEGSMKPARPGENARDARGGDEGYAAADNHHGRDGESGPAVESAQNGAGGQPIPGVEGGLFIYEPDTAAKSGEDGAHGSGGGGGGGSYFHDNFSYLSADYYAPGTGGAGGGAGGCGGTGGEPGTAGGSSFGLFMASSDSTIRDSKFGAEGGGQGGTGGSGGLSGDGGRGGAGVRASKRREVVPGADPNRETYRWHDVQLPYYSGDGGRGADGAKGGHGGGGAGGSSYGIFCDESRPTIDPETNFTAGDEGPGGQSSGYDGQKGRSVDRFNCD